MFRCFVDSLVRPKNIANHINMKLGKLIGYLLILIFISSLPTIVTIFTSNSVPETYANTLVTELKKNDAKLDFVIEDGKLYSKTNNNDLHIIKFTALGEEASNGQFDIATYIVFNQKNEDIVNSGKLLSTGFIFNLKSEEVELLFYNPNAKIKSSEVVSGTYNELDANGIDFSQIDNYSTYTLEVKIEKVITQLFKPYLFFVYLGSVPSALLSTGISVLFEIAFLVLFVFIFFRSSQLTFGEIFKLITLCMTPTAVISIYMLLPFGNIWYYGLYFVGQIITLIYFYKSIRQVYINKMKKE